MDVVIISLSVCSSLECRLLTPADLHSVYTRVYLLLYIHLVVSNDLNT